MGEHMKKFKTCRDIVSRFTRACDNMHVTHSLLGKKSKGTFLWAYWA
jgi:hypothetical protein